MIQVGIFTRYLPYTLEETANRIRRLGFNTVQLDVEFKDMDLATDSITKEKCITIRDAFRRHNLPISCISGYTNLVHPDAGKRKKNLDRLKQIIRYAHDLGSPYVISETGTFNADSDWEPHAKNKTGEGYDDCREAIKNIVDFSREHGVTFLIEAHVKNVIGSIEEVLRLFANIQDQHLGLLMDPTNYFHEGNIDKMDKTLNQIFNALSHKIKIAHAKDVKRDALADLGIVRPAPGLGSLNYDLYLQRLSKHHPNIPIIIEHLEEADVPRAKQFLDEKLRMNGC
ncbi:MAG: sugar phosphate isomerase/epimerase family protein [Chitinophagaceae bacterium]